MGRKKVDPIKRFFAKVDFRGPKQDHMKTRCWNWTACKDRKGYALFHADGESRAHRWIWKQVAGPIEEQLDHRCRNTSCVRPSHLRPCTNLENQQWKNKQRTHCIHGHPLSGDNVRVTTTTRKRKLADGTEVISEVTQRFCRQCSRDYQRELYWKRKGAA